MKMSILSILGLALAGLTFHAEAQVSAKTAKTPFVTTGPITLPLHFDHYYTYEQVGEALKALHAAYPKLTTLESVGKSEEGRDIWAMTVNNPATGAPSTKPGVYVDGNIHGNEIQAGEVCLGLLNRLLTLYGQNEQITKLVDRNVYYVVPVVNVDGRFHFLADASTSSSQRSIRIPVDDDRDGLLDEDGPDDLDGDGNICRLRRKDPFGVWKTDPEDPRLMVRIKPGEVGEWTLLGDEGIDNDGDGKINEDAEGYVDGNRNWGFNWMPPYVQSGAGAYPFQAKGLKALATFLVERPNILVVYAFHNNGGMFLRGPSTKLGEPMNARDVAVYDVLGKHAEKIVPGYRYLVSWKDLYATNGDFVDFTDNVVASYGFVGELFQSESESYRAPAKPGAAAPPPPAEGGFMGRNPDQERERILFNDKVVQGDLYRPWKPFKHPQLGEIEIGGWVKMSSRLPHPFMLNDLVYRNVSAVLFAASQTPEIKLEVLSVEKAGPELHRIRVRLSNPNAIPSMTHTAVQHQIHPKDTLKVEGTGLKVVAGGPIAMNPLEEITYKPHKPEIQFLQVPGYGKVEYSFLVSGKGKAHITYQSLKAGRAAVSAELK
ncbi:MAG: M14 family metallopeptidase [Holophaga sp.]|nr:M14 family metallopeptidase [Holophaga sp.]